MNNPFDTFGAIPDKEEPKMETPMPGTNDVRNIVAAFLAQAGKRLVRDLIPAILEYARNIGEVLSPESLKMAMNYVELQVPSLDFPKLVEIAKENFTGLNRGEGIAVVAEGTAGAKKVSMVALSASNEVCLGESGKPYVVIEAGCLAGDLVAAFGGKDMLVLK